MESVTFTGRQFRLVLGVGAYEFEEATNFDDKNWLTGSVELEVGSSTDGVIQKTSSVFWVTTELADFERELHAALEMQKSRTAGRAELATLEDEVELQIMVRLDEATISGRVEQHSIASVTFGETPTTAHELERALAQLGQITAAFPVRH